MQTPPDLSRIRGSLNNLICSHPDGSHRGREFLVNEKCYCLRTFICSEKLFSACCVADTVLISVDELGIDFACCMWYWFFPYCFCIFIKRQFKKMTCLRSLRTLYNCSVHCLGPELEVSSGKCTLLFA